MNGAAADDVIGADVINADVINKFHRTGVVCLRGLFSHDWLEKLIAGVEKNFAATGPPGQYQRVYTPPANPADSTMTTATGGALTNTGILCCTPPPPKSPRG